MEEEKNTYAREIICRGKINSHFGWERISIKLLLDRLYYYSQIAGDMFLLNQTVPKPICFHKELQQCWMIKNIVLIYHYD